MDRDNKYAPGRSQAPFRVVADRRTFPGKGSVRSPLWVLQCVGWVIGRCGKLIRYLPQTPEMIAEAGPPPEVAPLPEVNLAAKYRKELGLPPMSGD